MTGGWERVDHLYPATNASHEMTETLTFILSKIQVSKIILQMSINFQQFLKWQPTLGSAVGKGAASFLS